MKNVHYADTYYADGFKSKQHSAKEEWKIRNMSECHTILERQRLSEDIVQDDSYPSEHHNIR